jgi:hypothetical protein
MNAAEPTITVLLDPTSELQPAVRQRSERLKSLEGRVVGLVDITKPRGDVFLTRLEALLLERGAVVRRYSKPTFAKPAPIDLRARIATECEAVIEALAD